MLKRDRKPFTEEFQFLIGRLDTRIAPSVPGPSRRFQFLIGRLDTAALREAAKNPKSSFNSS